MAAYEYDFSAFESSAARKLKRADEKREYRPKLVKIEAEAAHEYKTPQQVRSESRTARIRYLRVTAAMAVGVMLFMTYLFALYKCDSIDRQIASLTTDYNMVCGENTELSMKLNNMVSLEQIEKVAVEELGLVKANSADIEFVRLEGENKVIVTHGKAVD